MVDTLSQSVRSSIRLAEGVAHYKKRVSHWSKGGRLENSSAGFCTDRWFRAAHPGECRYDVSAKECTSRVRPACRCSKVRQALYPASQLHPGLPYRTGLQPISGRRDDVITALLVSRMLLKRREAGAAYRKVKHLTRPRFFAMSDDRSAPLTSRPTGRQSCSLAQRDPSTGPHVTCVAGSVLGSRHVRPRSDRKRRGGKAFPSASRRDVCGRSYRSSIEDHVGCLSWRLVISVGLRPVFRLAQNSQVINPCAPI